MSSTGRNIYGPLLALVAATNAYQISFYAGTQCNSARLGGLEIKLDGTCHDAAHWAGTAQSVIITKTTEDDNTVVAFYDHDNCSVDRAVSSANGGCIQVGSGGNNFGSFNVIGGEFRPPPGGWPDAVAARDETADEWVNLPKHTFSDLKHGDFQEVDGRLVRMRQIGSDAFVGVEPEAWDDKLEPDVTPLSNIKSVPSSKAVKPVELVPVENAGVSDATPGQSVNPAMILAIPGSECRLVRDCVWVANYYLMEYFPESTVAVVGAIEDARQRTTGDNILRFLSNSFVAGFATASGIIGIYGVFRGDPPQEPCVQQSRVFQPDWENFNKKRNDADWEATVVQAINGVASPGGQEVQAVAARLVIDGREGTLHIALVPEDERNNGQFCGAPAEPGGGIPTSRVKRSMYADVPGFTEWVTERYGV